MNASTLHGLWQSPWLERVGWTLLHFLWQGTLAAVVLAAVLAGLRGASARTRYLVSVLGAAAACLLPLLTFSMLPLPAGPPPTANPGREMPRPSVARALIQGASSAAAPLPLSAATAAAKPPVPLQPMRGIAAPGLRQVCHAVAGRARPLLPWCAALWAVGVAVLSLRLLAGWTQVQRLRRRGTVPADGRWQMRLEGLARRLGIRQAVQLLESTLAEVPAVVGWLRPVVLVPVGVLAGLSTAQVEMILAHELAHIRRQDYLVNLGLTLFETLGFYHPAVWWIARCVRAEREHACDDLAVSACGGDRVGYVRALATLEEMRGPAGQFALAASGGGHGLLLARVRRLLGVTPERRPRSGHVTWWLAGAIALLAALAITLGGLQRPAQAQETPGTPLRPPAAEMPIGPRDLAGHAVDARNVPMAGARVTVLGAYPEVKPILTDATGTFRFPDFGDRHSLCLEVEKSGYGTRWEADLTPGLDFTVRLENATRFRGRFYRPGGAPVGSATIILFADKRTRRPNMNVSPRLERHTDEHGGYDFPVEPGTYRVEITADNDNLVARQTGVEAVAGRANELPGTLQTGLTLRIQTVDSGTGQPAPGARFYVREDKGPSEIGPRAGSERQTDARGFARWDHLFPGPVFLDVNRDPAYGRFWSTDEREHGHGNAPKGPHPLGSEAADGSLFIDVLPGRGDDLVVVQTERGVKVSGRVLDPQGHALGGVPLHVIMSYPGDKPGDETVYGLNGFPNVNVSAADGSFHDWCIPAGNGGLTRLVAEDSASQTLGNGHSEPFPSVPGDEREVTIRLTTGGWIEGSIVDAQGKPLADTPVVAAALDQLDGYANHLGPKTDAQGHFRIGPLRPAEYEVRARGASFDWNHPEPPEERRRVSVKAGEVVRTGPLHFDPTGWTAPPPPPPVATSSPAPVATPRSSTDAAPDPAPTPEPLPPAPTLPSSVVTAQDLADALLAAARAGDGGKIQELLKASSAPPYPAKFSAEAASTLMNGLVKRGELTAFNTLDGVLSQTKYAQKWQPGDEAVSSLVEEGRTDFLDALITRRLDLKRLSGLAGKGNQETGEWITRRVAEVTRQRAAVEALAQAAKGGDLPAMRRLIDAGVDVNGVDKGDNTPLIEAVFKDRVEAARLLLDHGAQVDKVRYPGWDYTPLCLCNSVEMAQLLKDRGANLHAKLWQRDVNILVYVAEFAKADLVAWFLRQGADPKMLGDNGENLLFGLQDGATAEVLLEAGADPNQPDDSGRTPLAAAQSAEVVQALVRHGANLKPKLKDGATLLEAAVLSTRRTDETPPEQAAYIEELLSVA